jgi:broad specificity phosphatase PhoE
VSFFVATDRESILAVNTLLYIMEVVFIRHGHAIHNQGFEEEGESAYHSEKYAYSPLTEKGHLQTLSVTVAPVDCIFVSPLIRCIETARNIFGHNKILYLHDGLIETQGHTPNRRESRDELCKHKNVNLKYVNDFMMEQSESPAQVEDRAIRTIRHILSESSGFKRIAIVTHHDWLTGLLKKSFKNAEVYTISDSEIE